MPLSREETLEHQLRRFIDKLASTVDATDIEPQDLSAEFGPGMIMRLNVVAHWLGCEMRLIQDWEDGECPVKDSPSDSKGPTEAPKLATGWGPSSPMRQQSPKP